MTPKAAAAAVEAAEEDRAEAGLQVTGAEATTVPAAAETNKKAD